MPWTGSTFIRTNGQFDGSTVWTSDYNNNIKILSSRHDTHDQDLAQGINACLNKNGANSAAANINFGGFKITNLAQGSSQGDSARFGQTITAATVNPSSKVLTLSRADGNITVDLTPIVVAGDTSDFARLSVDSQVFEYAVTFGGVKVSAGAGLTLNSGTGTILQWDIYRDNIGWYLLRNGGEFLRVENSGSDLFVASNAVWHAGNFDPSDYIAASDNAQITGSWSFANQVQFGGINVFASGGASWYTYAVGPTFSIGQGAPNGLGISVTIDNSESAGAYGYLGNGKLWNDLNWAVGTTAPTGGKANDVKLVTSGADKGLWANVSGVWTKIL